MQNIEENHQSPLQAPILSSYPSPSQGPAPHLHSGAHGALGTPYQLSNSTCASSTYSVQTKMRKSNVSFNASFVGLSGFASDVGAFTSSPLVELEDRLWSVRIYPGGKTTSSAGYLSCSIALESRGKTRASFRISLCNQMGWKNHTHVSDSVKTFSNISTDGESTEWGEAKFILNSDLRHTASGHCVDDTIVIQVDLTIYGDLEKSVIATSKEQGTSDRGKSLQDDLSRVLYDSSMADILIQVTKTSEVIPAHKFVLCLRSEVFRAMFQGGMAETLTSEVLIEDFSVIAIKEMLRYLYTDHCDSDVLACYGEELLALACKYGLGGLQTICANYLCSILTVSNVAGILNLADVYQVKYLKSRALMFLSQNVKSVVKSEGFFSHLSASLSQEIICIIAGVNCALEESS